MPTVLVVDDEFGIVELFEGVLSDEGYRVLSAMNGKEGLEVMSEERPDMVFLDYMMPVMDGAAMLAVMRADATLRDIPVVLISSMPEPIVAERCSGYVTFLRKPFKLAQLTDAASQLLGPGKPDVS